MILATILGAAVLTAAAAASAQDVERTDLCAALEPARPEDVRRETIAELDAELRGWAARLAGAGASGGARISEEITARLMELPNSDVLYALDRAAYLSCLFPDRPLELEPFLDALRPSPAPQPAPAQAPEAKPQPSTRWIKPTPFTAGTRLVRGDGGWIYALGQIGAASAVVAVDEGAEGDAVTHLTFNADFAADDIAWTARDGLVVAGRSGSGPTRTLQIVAQDGDGAYRARYRRRLDYRSVQSADADRVTITPVAAGWLATFAERLADTVLLDRNFDELAHRGGDMERVFGVIDAPGHRAILLGSDTARRHQPRALVVSTDPDQFLPTWRLRPLASARFRAPDRVGFLNAGALSPDGRRVVVAGRIAHREDAYSDDDIFVAGLDADGAALWDFELEGEAGVDDHACCVHWIDDVTALVFSRWRGSAAAFKVDARTGRRARPLVMRSSDPGDAGDMRIIDVAAVSPMEILVLAARRRRDDVWRITISRQPLAGSLAKLDPR